MALGLNLPKNGQKSLAKMAARMKEMQNQLAIIEEKEYESIAGNKEFVEIKAIVNGKLKVVDIKNFVSPEIISKYKNQKNTDTSEYLKEIKEISEAIADLTQVAINNALSKAIDEKERISNSATNGLDIKGLF